MNRFSSLKYLILFFTIIIVQKSFAQWQTYQMPVPLLDDLNCISFVNSSTAYIGSDSRIIKCLNNFTALTSDTFKVHVNGPGGPLVIYPVTQVKSLHFTSLLNGFVTGNFNLFNQYDIFYTTDSSFGWTSAYSNAQGSLRTFSEFDWSGINSVACGTAGKLVRSTDNGQTWNAIATGVTNDLSDVVWLSASSLICAGHGVILRSANAGVSWISDTTGWSAISIRKISAVTNVVYMNSDTKIFRSVDNGNTFSTISIPISGDILSVKAVSADTVYAGTTEGLYKSTDAGQHWQLFNFTRQRKINEIAFDNGKIYLLCDSSFLLVSSLNNLQPDATAFGSLTLDDQCGVTHLTVNNFSDPSFQSRWYLNGAQQPATYNFSKDYTADNFTDIIKLIVSNGTSSDTLLFNVNIDVRSASVADAGSDISQCYNQQTLLTADSAQHYEWTPHALFAVSNSNYYTQQILTAPFTSTQQVYLTTHNSDNCYATDTLTIYIAAQQPAEYFHKTFPNPPDQCGNASCAKFTDIDFVSRDTGFAYGNFGGLARTYDAGASWTLLPPPASTVNPFRAGIDFISGSVGYVSGVCRKTIDGGLTLLPLNGIGGSFADVSFADQMHGMFSGDGASITDPSHQYVYKTSDGGATLTKIFDYTINSTFFIRDIRMLDPNHLYLVGSFTNAEVNARFLKSSDGGVTWINVVLPPEAVYALTSVSVLNPDTIFACGFGGNIYKTSDGGANWSVYNIGSTYELTSIKMIDSETGYAISFDGNLYKTINGGDCWQVVKKFSEMDERVIALSPDHTEIFASEAYDGYTKPVIHVSQSFCKLINSLDTNFCARNLIHTHNESTGYTSYSWKLDNIFYSSEHDTSFYFASAGMHRITLTGDSANVKYDSLVYTVSIDSAAGQIGSILGGSLCSLTPISSQLFRASNSDFAFYYWSHDGGTLIRLTSFADLSDSAYLTPDFITWPASFHLAVFAVDSRGCVSDTVSRQVNIFRTGPDITATSPVLTQDSIVVYSSSCLTNLPVDTISTFTSPGDSTVDFYLWQINNGYFQSYQSIQPGINIPLYMYAPYAGYMNRITVQYSNSCGSSAVATSYFGMLPEPVSFVHTPDTLAALNSTFSLTDKLIIDTSFTDCATPFQKWMRNGVTLAIDDSLTLTNLQFADTGYYEFNIEFGLINHLDSVHVGITGSVYISSMLSPDVAVTPNPFTDHLTIYNHDQEAFSYTLTGAAGQQISSGIARPGENVIEVKALKSGIYWLSLERSGLPEKWFKLIRD